MRSSTLNRLWIVLAAVFTISAAIPASSQSTSVDLELVLAVDVSLSMDLDEQRLQRDGYVYAFRDAEVIKAILSGPNGRIAVTYMEWAGSGIHQIVLPWTIIDSAAAAQDFARRLEVTAISRARMTSISSALHYADELFKSSGVRGLRRVVDVSGDGPNNSGVPVAGMRDQLVAKGITINGLPIVLKRPSSAFDIENLEQYYKDCVIGGPGAFVVPIRETTEFRSATRRKLLLEIAGLRPPPLVRVQALQEEPRADCLAGERRWNRYMREP